ncbi:PTS sugar transporter subunit IIA [Symbiobacterium thermophilum]|uniref:PTS N-acetylgalactosamine IIA subunit n=1 Tax=Symbiobacterium thermophilum TaxID=2734 RepID=A0A953LL00_SYMTR|nr:PTS sugar transporter subunit IIA [Symbiobacterium thermophilum]MBY6277597.1 PTS N-acetylgalactosamine IIA subunit [Symbiobacterium thermophilum]
MIGCIITGHGEFAPGLAQALSMIAGPQPHFAAVPFREEAPLADYERSLADALADLLGRTAGVLIFTDLLGGTPFRTAMLLASRHDNVAVLTGTNLPMLIETGLLAAAESDVQTLARQAVETGTGGVQWVRMPPEGPGNRPADDGEGI